MRGRPFRVAWPRSIEVVQLRRHERVRISVPCEAVFPDGRREDAEINDISTGGCGFITRKRPKKDVVVELSFALARGLSFENIKAVVCNVTVSRGRCQVGCRFSELGVNDSHHIDLFVVTKLEGTRTQVEDVRRASLSEAADS